MSAPKDNSLKTRPMGVEPSHVRMARAALGWSQEELAKRSGVSRTCVRNFESERNKPTRETVLALENAFKAEGIQFIKRFSGEDNSATEGVLHVRELA